MKLPASVRVTGEGSGYPIYEIEHAMCSARVALHGAHVMSWKPVGEEEVLYLSPDSVFKEGKAIRGGIPLCWPWFGAHPSDGAQPAHGIARTRFLKLEGASEDENGVKMSFSLDDGKWHARVRVSLGKELEVALETLNLGEEVLKVSGALHSYFEVGDVEKVRLLGLDGVSYFDKTVSEGEQEKIQEGALKFEGEVDFVYDSDGSCQLVDEASGRVIRIEKSGSPSTVVWNPWVEKAAAMGDLPDAGYRDFVCAEAAIANERAITVEPGGSHVLTTRISVAPL